MLLSPDLGRNSGLVALFIASFLAATFVPFSSEAALFAVLRLHPDMFSAAIIIATIGNTAGGMVTYGMGRWLAQRKPLKQLERVARWGAPATALGWLPFVGDAICLAAGWLKLNWPSVLLWQFAGRAARYWVVAQGSLL